MRKKDMLAAGLYGRFSPLKLGLNQMRSDRVSILAYHRVTPFPPADYPYQEETVAATPEGFREQLQFLKRHCYVTTFKELHKLIEAGEEIPKNTVIITFDDGYEDNYSIAAPLLADAGLPAVIYVVTDCIDNAKPFWFETLSYDLLTANDGTIELPGEAEALELSDGNRRQMRRRVGDLVRTLDDAGRHAVLSAIHEYAITNGSPEPEDRLVMTWDEVRELSNAGIEIGSHTVTHPFLSRLTEGQIIHELGHSKMRIEQELATECMSLAYPTGGREFYDDRVLKHAEDQGYRYGVSYEHGAIAFDAAQRFELPRIHVETDVPLPLFKANILMPSIFLRGG